MDEALAGGEVEGPGGVEPDHQGLGGSEPPPLIEHGPQAASSEELEHQVRPVVLTPVVDGHEVGVAKGGRRPGLGLEPAQEGLVVG